MTPFPNLFAAGLSPGKFSYTYIDLRNTASYELCSASTDLDCNLTET